jgi:cellulose synthase (UDP-forming)
MEKKPRSPFAEAWDKISWALVPLSFIFSARYLVWRAFYSIDFSGTAQSIVSIALLVAETIGYFTFVLFYWQTYNPTRLPPIPVDDDPDLPTVDVFITTLNEPADILYKTLVGCTELDYPANRLAIYVLDDGGRDEIKALAEEFGAKHIARGDRTHAKAGNLNFGLKHSDGELILILDCDHVPVTSFLKETVGFFKDKKVGFVQTPHHFYNPDCYRKNLFLEQELSNEQDLFFHVIQPGRNRNNSAIFAGSVAVMRRAALEEIGGCRTETAIEDLHTGMELHSRGYKSIFYERTISGALSPENFMGYLIQRCRWTRGGVQVFLLDNPIFKSGLDITQRFFYLASLLYFFHGWIRLVFLFAPLSFLLFKIQPINADTWTLATYFIPHYVLSHYIFNRICREYRSPFWSDVYETGGAFFLAWTAFITILRPEKLVFHVTPKGEAQPEHEVFHWNFVLPHIILMALLLLGVIKTCYHFANSGINIDAFALSCGWAAFNIVLLATSIEVAREHPKTARNHRIHRTIPVELSFVGHVLSGKTFDLSETGTSIIIDEQIHVDHHVRVMLLGDFNLSVELEGEVVRTEWLKDGTAKVAVKFLDVTPAQRRGIVRHMFSPSESWESVTRPRVAALKAFSHIAGVTVRKRARKIAPRRKKGEHHEKNLAGAIHALGRTFQTHVEHLALHGAIIRVDEHTTLPKKLDLELNQPGVGKMTIHSEVVRRMRNEHHEHRYEIHFLSPETIDPHAFDEPAELAGEAEEQADEA